MVFSKNIIKLGKAEILNGVITEDEVLTLYYSKEGDRVYKKIISLGTKLPVWASSEPISSSEILPLFGVTLSRVGQEIGVFDET